MPQCLSCDNFACLHTHQDQNELHLKYDFFFAKIGIFCKSIAGLLSEAKTHWMVNWPQLLNQLNFVWGHTKVFVSTMSQKCSIAENDGELILMASRTFSATAAIFQGVRTVFSFSRFGLSMRMKVFFHFFHKITNIRSWRCFSSSKICTQFSHSFCKHYYDFQSNVAIFPSVVQACTQLYSFDGRIKLIICQIRHELTVTIHEISTSWKKER